MAAFVSALSPANWSNLATWSQDGGTATRLPGAGDTVAISSGHTITADIAATIGAGTGVALTLGTSGTGAARLVVGAGLTIRGHVRFAAGWTYLEIAAGGAVEMDGDAGFTPLLYSFEGGGVARVVFSGTAESPASLKTKAGSLGGKARTSNLNASETAEDWTYQYASVLFSGAYATVTDFGDATQWGVRFKNLWTNGDGSAPRNVLDHVTFLRANLFVEAADSHLNGVNAGLILRHCSVIDPPIVTLAGPNLVGAYLDGLAGNGTRVVELDGSAFAANVLLKKLGPITGTIFADGYCYYTYADFATSWVGNFVSLSVETSAPSGVTNADTYWQMRASYNPHWFGAVGDVTGCLFDAPFTPAGAGLGDAIMIGDNLTVEIAHNIMLPALSGDAPGKLVSCLTNAGSALNIHHNTGIVQASEGGLVQIGENEGNRYVGLIAACRDNIAWGNGTPFSQYEYLLHDQWPIVSPGAGSAPLGTVANVDYNCVWRCRTGTNTIGGVATDLPGYANLVSADPVGAHDQHVDPQFVDPTRHAIAWYRTQVGATDPAFVAGQDGATDNAKLLAWLVAHPDQVAALRAWVRAGYAPTNAALKATGHDGSDIGAMAWTSGSGSAIEIGRVLAATESIPVLHLYGHSFHGDGGGRWWRSFGDRIDGLPADPRSDQLMALLRSAGSSIRFCGGGSTASGGDSAQQIPFNVVPGDGTGSITILPADITLNYPSISPSFLVPAVPPAMGQENNVTNDYYTYLPDSRDYHVFTIERNEDTGGIKSLTEFYQLTRPGSPTEWAAASGRRWLLGETPPLFCDATTASGLPFFPFLARSEEIPNNIGHAIALAIPQGCGHRDPVWPARLAAAPGGSGVPLGAKLRLKKSYYDARKNEFTGGGLALFNAMAWFGLILTDWADGGMWMSLVTDDGWVQSEIAPLAGIPPTAFEIVQMPHYARYSGPRSVRPGEPITVTIAHEPADDPTYKVSNYAMLQRGNESPEAMDLGGVEIGAGAPTEQTVTFTPPGVGAYSFYLNPGGFNVFQEPFRFTVAEAATGPRPDRAFLGASGPLLGRRRRPVAPSTFKPFL